MSWCEIAVAIADCGLRIHFPEDTRPDNPQSTIRNPQSAIRNPQ
jgi:hypothetical protein